MSRPERVLIVDDDASILEALKDALEEEGLEAVASADGADALRRLREGYRPDAILLDHMMPVMDGPSFVAELAAEPSLRDLPIILLTADLRAPSKAYALGLRAFLRKPLKIDALLEAIRGAIASRAP